MSPNERPNNAMEDRATQQMEAEFCNDDAHFYDNDSNDDNDTLEHQLDNVQPGGSFKIRGIGLTMQEAVSHHHYHHH